MPENYVSDAPSAEIVSSAVREGYRLSPQQQRVWLLRQQSGSGFFVAQCLIELDGQLKALRLVSALNELVNRYEILRTEFRLSPGADFPIQVIREPEAALVERYDLSRLAERSRAERLRRLLAEAKSKIAEYDRSPLFRAALIKLGRNRHLLALSLNALCADAESLVILYQKLGLFYGGRGPAGVLEEEPLQYADLAEFFNGELDSEDASAGREYWADLQLEDLIEQRLPCERRSARAEGVAPQSRSLRLSPQIWGNIKAVSERAGCMPRDFLLTCWAILHWRWMNGVAPAVGVKFDGRGHDESAEAVGLASKFLPFRIKIEPELPFSALLTNISEGLKQMETWQEYFVWPSVDSPPIGRKRIPFFPSAFEFTNGPPSYSAAGVAFSALEIASCIDHFNLKLSCLPVGDHLQLGFSYDPEVYIDRDVDCLIDQWSALVSHAIESPSSASSQLNLLSEGARRTLLFEWNRTEMDFAPSQPLHRYIQQQADRTPDRTAVVYREECLSYGELERRSNRTAQYLRKRGVGPESRVGVCLERRAEMVMALLGILKAGAAYVPLDPDHPAQRLQYMLENGGIRWALTDDGAADKLRGCAVEALNIDQSWEEIGLEPPEAPRVEVFSDNLGYIIYTSGSTGRPKGAMNTHAGITNRLRWMQEVFQLNSDDRVFQKTPFSFDVSVWEFFWPLMYGAQLVVAEPGGHRDSRYLVGEICRRAVTTTHFVPSMLRGFLEEEKVNECTSLRRVMSSGEELSREIVDRHRELMSCELHNLYGPTEAAVDVTWWNCERLRAEDRVLIGGPIGNTRVYVLDGLKEPVGVGMIGELYLGGVQLSRGYVNGEAQTSERFLPDGLSGEPGARLYQTGDLVRRRSDGALEYLGRADHQVKVSGFRIELGEIESVLREQQGVRDAVVVVWEGKSGARRLVGVVEAGPTVSSEGLREELRRRLPEYMTPGTLVRMDRLPLTHNGKLDRLALRSFDFSEADGAGDATPPRTPVEEMLAQIWRDVLKLHQVDIHADFFDLGGHSLLVTQVVSRIRQVFQIDLTFNDVFSAPTIAGLAERIMTAIRKGNSTPPPPPIKRAERGPHAPLSYGQRRLWVLEQLNPGSSAYHIPIILRIDRPLDLTALERSFTEVIRRHECLRARFATVDDELVQVIQEPVPFQIPLSDLSGLAERQRRAEISRLIEEGTRKPFDFGRDSLIRAAVIKTADDKHLLFACLHHLVADDWSLNVLERELTHFYSAYSERRDAHLDEPPIRYADYAIWQRGWLEGEEIGKQISYWREQLEGIDGTPRLPTDRRRPARLSSRGGAKMEIIGRELSERIKTMARRCGVTLYMFILGGLAALLKQYTGQDEVIVGTPIAGRNRLELEGLVGFFLNTLVLRLKAQGKMRFIDLLTEVRRVTLEAYAHQDAPFDRLVEELRPERALSYSPLFQIWFNLITLSGARLGDRQGDQLNGIGRGPQNVETKYELAFYAYQYSDGIEIELVYSRDLFEAATIQQMGRRLVAILDAAAGDVNRRCDGLLPIEPAEIQSPLMPHDSLALDAAFVPFLRQEIECSIPDRFERQVKLYGSRIAIKTRHQAITYESLNRAADRVARGLLRLTGSGPDRIGLLFDHGAPMIAAVLAVLKAGKTYVPLDASHPRRRIEYILKDSEAAFLIADQGNRALAEVLSAGAIPVASLGELEEAGSSDSGAQARPAVSPDAIAYILYTSGSTGQPKGVMQNHRNVLHFIGSYTNNLQISCNDRLSLLASFSFDAAVMDIYGALLNGAALFPLRISDGAPEIVTDLTGDGVTIYHSTPTVFRYVFGSQFEDRIFTDMRLVVLGGEETLRSDVELYRRHCRLDCLMINGFGPTESTVTLQYPIDHQARLTGDAIPIGHAVAETEILLFDQEGEPAPIQGEIAIRSPYLALGYWKNAEATAVAFTPDPEGREWRIYRTGDLARRLHNQALVYAGRKDFQIKIRGMRVELGEIEAVISEHPSVRESAVIFHEAPDQEGQLAAFVVPKGNLLVGELKAYLRDRLPAHMLPASIRTAAALPMTPTGKIDRRALLASAPAERLSKESLIAPRDAIELQLAQMWKELLRTDQIGVTHNFFDLGGTSLSALALLDSIGRRFDIKLPLAALFAGPTIERLGGLLRNQAPASFSSSLTPIQPHGARRPFFCVHPGGGSVVCYLDLASRLGSDQPFYGFQARGLSFDQEPHQRIEDMAAYYIDAMRQVQPCGPYLLGGWSMGGIVAFEMAQQLRRQGQAVGLVALFDTERPVTQDSEAEEPELSDAELALKVLGEDLKISLDELRGLDPEEQIAVVMDVARRSHRITPDLDYSRARRWFDVYRSNRRALLNYRATIYPGRLTLFSCLDDEPLRSSDPSFGWGDFAGQGVEVIPGPGNHRTMIQEPFAAALAARLRDCMSKLDSIPTING